MKFLAICLSHGVLLLLLGASNASANTIGFVYSVGSNSVETIQYPGATQSFVTGINDSGTIVGNFYNGSAGFFNGFVTFGGTFMQLNYPGAYDTALRDINNLGQITGDQATWGEGGRAFLADSGSFKSFDYPGAQFTYGDGINDQGTIIGSYRVSVSVPGGEQSFDHGLYIAGATLLPFDFPAAPVTRGAGINNLGQILGNYYDGESHGFLLDGGAFTSIDFPGALSTEAHGINDLGQIVGSYSDSNHFTHAFLMDANGFTSFDFPSPTGALYTSFAGINNAGQIVGNYAPRPPVFVPESSFSFVLLAIGLLGVIGFRTFLQGTVARRSQPRA